MMKKNKIKSGLSAFCWLGFSLALLTPALAHSAALVNVYVDSLASGWADWGWSETSTNDTVLFKTGTASQKVSVTANWGAYSASKTSGNHAIGLVGAISFDINPGSNVTKTKALRLLLEGSGTGTAVTIAGYATPAIAANTWSAVRIPIAAIKGSLTTLTRIDLQDGSGTGAFIYNIDNLVVEAAASPSPTPVPTATPSPTPVPTPTPSPSPLPTATACSSTSGLVCSEITVGTLQRKFFTHVPPASPAPAARPVVLFFHGDSQTGDMLQTALYNETDLDGAVVVQLDGPNNVVPSLGRGTTSWALTMNGTSPDDVQFTKTVHDGIVAGLYLPGLTIDPKRISIAGVSRGGFFVYNLMMDARTAPLFAAGAVMYGNAYCESSGDSVCSARLAGPGLAVQAPIVHIHGTSDTSVSPPAAIPSPYTATITSWPYPAASISNALGCSGNYAYNSTLTSIGGNNTYLYQPSGSCAYDYRLVLVQNGVHGFTGWQPYAWSFLKSKAKP